MQPSAWESAKYLPGSPSTADSSGKPAGMGVRGRQREGNWILMEFAGRSCLIQLLDRLHAGGVSCTGCTGLLAGLSCWGKLGELLGEPLAVPHHPGWGARRVIAMETDERVGN